MLLYDSFQVCVELCGIFIVGTKLIIKGRKQRKEIIPGIIEIKISDVGAVMVLLFQDGEGLAKIKTSLPQPVSYTHLTLPTKA